MRDRDDEDGRAPASEHARSLLAWLGATSAQVVESDAPALAWRRAGLMAMTGRPDGPGLVAPVALTCAADGALAALRALAPKAKLPLNGAVLLGERARLRGLTRRGATSPNGSCRLVQARDGWIALNLPRPDDWELTPALFGEAAPDWASVERLACTRACEDLLAQGRLLGLAIARHGPTPAPSAPFTVTRLGPGRQVARPPLVLDLSALWAGPLAASLLQSAGARVVKVESLGRPDGARAGDPRVFDLLNGGKASVALDFSSAADLERLRRMVAAADVVIESARPRALAALGVSAEATARGGATWVSITAHGRAGEAGNWIGFGDDAGVAGGVSAAMAQAWGEPLFAGDAVADPLTGITAALAAWASWRAGGGRLVSLALSEVVVHACALRRVEGRGVRRWQAAAEADTAPLYTLRTPQGPAARLGADTAALLAEFAP